ncbi:MAG: ATP-binding cassette domain-containing protein [Acidobacteriota bacterium]|nr:ATP-binding cassette domain-containing protein [Acidobacteriota bacterium]
MPLITLEKVSIAYGHLPLLDDVALQVEPGERIAIIGRNGTGKSTLMQIIGGELRPDSGTVWTQPGARVARLVQDVPLSADRPVFDVIAEGLGDLSAVITNYHHAAVEVATNYSDEALTRLGDLQHELEERDGWQLEQRVELIVTKLGLPSEAIVDTLSGGWRRRVLLARALVGQPDVLLLDEPTNHLDIEAIEWLEAFLIEYPGAVIFVTHDRAFLERVGTRVVEIDRGRLTSWPGDYATFERKKEEWLANEELQQTKFDKKMASEEVWLRRGVKARRTRDEGRVKALMAMRAERAARRAQIGNVRMQIEQADPTGKMVFEAKGVSHAFGGDKLAGGDKPSRGDKPFLSAEAPGAKPEGLSIPVIKDLSIRVMRGDRIGLIGPNGAGKTTLLRLLLGELTPQSGTVRHGANVQIAYYDQQREQLDPERTVVDTIGDGNDTVTVNGQPRHVHGYLQDFLFSPERARSPVKALSGGERNRLLLARLFTRPANVLVLDEPTNDLDLETLELLEAQLVEWPGTLLLVSHDRRFLDNVVTSTLVFEGGGKVQEYVGGYEDWLRQKLTGATKDLSGVTKQSSGVAKQLSGATKDSSSKKTKRTFKEEREYKELPARIAALEAEQKTLHAAVSGPDFYKKGAGVIKDTLARIEAIDRELLEATARWDVLDSLQK